MFGEKVSLIRDDFNDGRINERDAIYKFKVLGCGDQDILFHLKSTGKYEINPETNFAIVGTKMVEVKTSHRNQIQHEFSGNKIQLSKLNEMQEALNGQKDYFIEYKTKLPEDHHLQIPVNAVIETHTAAIEKLKTVQRINLSEDRIDPQITAASANGVMDGTAQITKEAQTAILDHKRTTNVSQKQQVAVTPSENPRSSRQRRPGKGSTASITDAFLQKDQIIGVNDESKTDYSKSTDYSLSNNSVYVLSEKTERFDTPTQSLGEGIPLGRPISSFTAFGPTISLFGLSTLLWIIYFYLRKKRLDGEKSEFQEKDIKIAGFNDIIIKFKSKELCLEDAQLLLIRKFDFTESGAREVLLKLSY